MSFKEAKCYLAEAQAEPKLRKLYKEKAADRLALCDSDKAQALALSIRFENILDAEVRAKDPTDLVYAASPLKDNWFNWVDNDKRFIATATDQDAKITAQLMLGEVYHDSLLNPGKVIEIAQQIDIDWRAHRTQAAWARLIWGGALQDEGRYKEAIAMYQSIIRDFVDADNFAHNDVRGLAAKLITICQKRMVKK